MKRTFICLIILILARNTNAQEQCTILSIDHFGGNGEDVVGRDIAYPDGSFNLTIGTNSTSGDILTGCTGGGVLRLYDANYNALLNESCAPIGTNFEYPTFFIFPQANGDTILIGRSNDNASDYGMERRDASGNVLWTKTYGGSGADIFFTAVPASDGGFFISGEAHSNDGDVGSHYGNYFSGDLWIVRVDNNGNILWSRVIGGTGEDGASTLIASADGGCYTFGGTTSDDYDATGNHAGGSEDLYVVKLDSLGTIQWHHCYGGSEADGAYVKAVEDGSGGFYMAATASSIDGDIQRRPAEVFDFWLLHIDSQGSLLWENTFGGPNWERLYDMCRASDGSLWMVGTSGGGGIADPVGKDVAFNYGQKDGWVCHADSLGNFINSRTLGSDKDDYLFMVHPLPDGTILAGGRYPPYITQGSSSPGFPEVTEGWSDIFLARLSPQADLAISEKQSTQNSWEVYPNPAKDEITVCLKDDNRKYHITITDANGRQVFCDKLKNKITIPAKDWIPGVYWVNLRRSDFSDTQKIIIRK